MSGHSKWATTKRHKAAQDAKRAALFSKLSRSITVAAKEGGDPDPENNAALAAAIDKAKSYSLPNDNIEKAINRAFGIGADAAAFETVIYEGYAPHGIAVYVEALTDNRNRTASDVRTAFSRSGGNLGTSGSVAFQFEKKGRIVIPKSECPDEEEFFMLVAEAGGDDFNDEGEEWSVLTDPAETKSVENALKEQGIRVKGSELIMLPNTTTELEVKDVKQVIRLIDKLEESDDIQSVYHTLDITDELIEALNEDG